MTAAIVLSEVGFRYAERSILSAFNVSVAQSEVLAVLGPSGSGKSTVLRLILGFSAPQTGSVQLGGMVVSRDGKVLIPPEERHLAVVFQGLALWPHLTVYGNLAFGLCARRVPRADQVERIRDILTRVGLAGKEENYPGELSGGERQRVAIARALVLDPLAVLMDEPLSNLDVPLKRDLLALFRRLFKERRSTVVYVTHDLREAEELGDRIVVMEQGRVVQEGKIDALRAQPTSEFVRALVGDLGWKG